jgi:hypothetical protein
MLFKETVTVHCENHTEHINTLCGQNAEFCDTYNSARTSQETLRLCYKDQPANVV